MTVTVRSTATAKTRVFFVYFNLRDCEGEIPRPYRRPDMYNLRAVQFLAVTLLVFRPICCDQKNHTEPVLNATKVTHHSTTETNTTTSTESAVVSKLPIIHTYEVYDNDTQKEIPPKKDESINATTPTISSTEASSITEKTTRNHRGREGVTDEPITPKNLDKNVTESANVTQSTTEITPVNVTITVQPHEIVPKKGVTLNMTVVTKQPENITSTTKQPSTTTTTLKPTKPKVTIGSDEENLPKNKNSSTVKVPTLEYYQQENSKTSNFVIPIVAVILSVPVVAIVLNILYKRGKEWWSHRHYRRMDFLVDGMYNN